MGHWLMAHAVLHPVQIDHQMDDQMDHWQLLGNNDPFHQANLQSLKAKQFCMLLSFPSAPTRQFSSAP